MFEFGKHVVLLVALPAIFFAPVLPVAAQVLPARAAVASAHPLASSAGLEILGAGGNAFDAAVATAAALAVVEPSGSGLGGGGFFLLHRSSDGFETMVDARETAPAAAHRGLFLGQDGEVERDRAINGPLAAGIPGEPAGLAHIARRYGRLPLAWSLAPAIRLAREGFPVGEKFLSLLEMRREAMARWPVAASVFLVDGELPPLGYVIRQPELAVTLERLAKDGRQGFYQGETAAHLVAGVRAAGGIWTLADLAGYRVKERKPVRIQYRGFSVVSASPPSSGGIALAEILHILEPWPLADMAPALRTHLLVEAMRRAYRDRSIYLGDPDFTDVPVSRLIDPDYAAGLRASIHPDKAMPSDLLPGGDIGPKGSDTTHFSLLDREGNLVSATLSINLPFGSAFMPVGTGVLLNNEMDDFSAKPGAPNAYGLVGGDANAIAPGKRMLSSMSPSFVFGPDRVAILGTPGGSRIISMVLLGILDFAAGHGPRSWVALPRFHHQYLPDVIFAEPGALSADVVADLEAMGHRVEVADRTWGDMQAVVWDRRSGEVQAASDPRGRGGSAMVRLP